jgi:hypothetical protein
MCTVIDDINTYNRDLLTFEQFWSPPIKSYRFLTCIAETVSFQEVDHLVLSSLESLVHLLYWRLFIVFTVDVFFVSDRSNWRYIFSPKWKTMIVGSLLHPSQTTRSSWTSLQKWLWFSQFFISWRDCTYFIWYVMIHDMSTYYDCCCYTDNVIWSSLTMTDPCARRYGKQSLLLTSNLFLSWQDLDALFFG